MLKVFSGFVILKKPMSPGKAEYERFEEFPLSVTALACPSVCAPATLQFPPISVQAWPLLAWASFTLPQAAPSAQGQCLVLKLNVCCITLYCDFLNCVDIFLNSHVFVEGIGNGVFISTFQGLGLTATWHTAMTQDTKISQSDVI